MWGVARWLAVEYGLPFRVQRAFWFLYVSRPVATPSRWCPWTSTGSPTQSSVLPWACCCWAWFTHWMHWFCHAGCVPEQAGRPRSGVRGRMLTAGASLGAALVLGSGAPASPRRPSPPRRPRPRPAPGARSPIPALAELSGLVAVGDQVLAVNDGGEQAAVHLLDAACQVVDVHTAAVDPYDPEDMAWAPTGPSGSPTRRRRRQPATVALLALRPDGTTGVYRLLPRRPARRRGAAPRPGRHAVPGHQGGAGREQIYARPRRWSTAGRSPWPRSPP